MTFFRNTIHTSACNRLRTGAVPLVLAILLAGCGGGGSDSGGGGARKFSGLCELSDLSVSPGTSATLSKANGSLSAAATLTLRAAAPVRITSNFEAVGADDWIEGYPVNQSLSAGGNRISISFDLRSPMKSVADRYTKLTIIADLPNDEACLATLPVNITLNP